MSRAFPNSASYPSPTRAWYALGVLTLVYVFFLSRPPDPESAGGAGEPRSADQRHADEPVDRLCVRNFLHRARPSAGTRRRFSQPPRTDRGRVCPLELVHSRLRICRQLRTVAGHAHRNLIPASGYLHGRSRPASTPVSMASSPIFTSTRSIRRSSSSSRRIPILSAIAM